MTFFLFIPFIPSILFDTSMRRQEYPLHKNQSVTPLHRERKERKEGLERKDGKDKSLSLASIPIITEGCTHWAEAEACPQSEPKGQR